jgi:hypothetical protein
VSRFELAADFTTQLEAEPGVRSRVAAAAREAGEETRSIGRELGGSGAFAGSIEVRGARVLTRDRAGHLIEHGSVNNPPYAPLRRAAEAVGARYVDTGPGGPA